MRGLAAALSRAAAASLASLDWFPLTARDVVAAARDDGLGHAAMAVQGVGGDGASLERQQVERCDGGLGLASGPNLYLGPPSGPGS